MGMVGAVDYFTGFEMSFSVFYLIAIYLSFWLVGKREAYVIAFLSIVIWAAGDWAAGYSKPYILIWNAVITMIFYVIVLALLSWLKSTRETLEERVKESTAALREEMAERGRLEKEILGISENERQLIGFELHDNLCQHLTGIAIAAQNVEQDLLTIDNPKTAADVGRLVDLVEEGIVLARDIARGLAPMHLEAEELTDAFEELASAISNRLKIDCRFEHEGIVCVDSAATGIHLYRIAQEAVTNAVRHGRAKHVAIRLEETEDSVRLTIKDDGCGLTDPPESAKGSGLRIMRHRANLIGAGFSIQSHPGCGMVVACSWNKATSLNHPDADEQ